MAKQAIGGGNIRFRKDGRWEARITIAIDPGTGKQIRRSVYGHSQKEVRQQLTEIRSALDKGTYIDPSRHTVATWLDEWRNTYCTNRVAPLTLSAYKGLIENHIKPQIGAVLLQAVRGSHIQRVYNAMIDAGLSGRTVRNVSALMHKAFSVALKQGLIPVNPCDQAEPPKMTKREIKPLDDSDIPVFLAAIEGHPFRNAYALCLFAGLREGECLGLSWEQVDFDNQQIKICQQLQKAKDGDHDYYISQTTKGGRSRTISPPPIAFSYLRQERQKQAEARLKAGRAWSNSDDLVFTDELGGHIKFSTFYKRFKKLAAAIGRPDARPHDLRHSAATVALASGADIKSVQDLLGHASASFTLNTYAHATQKMKEDTANRVQQYYDGLRKQG